MARGANPVYYVASDPGLPRPIALSRALEELQQQMSETGMGAVGLSEVVSKVQIFDEMLLLHQKLFEKLRRATESASIGITRREVAAVESFHDTHVGLFLKPFSAVLPDHDHANVYMEREWRVLGNVRFTLSDVARVILPKRFAMRLRQEVPEYFAQVHFPDVV